ncbi:MAG: Gfo/Idh/MocA family oxidoreductase [Armatimonadetes bacterium]|nr:Gfo/Idh/MocA family oxidoreductase [Armatimonadota bacterium]
MTQYRVGFIGVGRPWRSEGATGFGMAYEHAAGYAKTGRCELMACADIVEDNARAFAEKNGVAKTYTDYEKMLADEELDIVSVCTWPHLHAPMTLAAAQSGVKAIHCEKPMAMNWGEAREMARVCDERGVKLTFNHQRRFLQPFQLAKKMARDGTIGELQRIEGNCGDMYDWGTHWLDMFFFYNNETPAEWVLGQIDSRRERKAFGVPLESQGLCQFRFQNGVGALLETGQGTPPDGVAHRLIGTDGLIEVRWDQPCLRVLSAGEKGWRVIDQPDHLHGPDAVARAIADVVDALAAGRESMLSAHNALRATEVIFATYESSRRRGRVDLPMTIDDNAFLSMLETGDIRRVATA